MKKSKLVGGLNVRTVEEGAVLLLGHVRSVVARYGTNEKGRSAARVRHGTVRDGLARLVLVAPTYAFRMRRGARAKQVHARRVRFKEVAVLDFLVIQRLPLCKTKEAKRLTKIGRPPRSHYYLKTSTHLDDKNLQRRLCPLC